MSVSVLFDYQIFFHQEYGGISRYVVELASNLSACRDTTAQIYAGRHHNAYLEQAPAELTVTGRRVRRGASTATNAASLIGNAASFFVHATRASFTHIHQTYFYELFRPLSKATRIVTVYDMTHELFPEQFAAPRRTSLAKRRAVRAADHVVCISESTRRDLIRLFDVPEDKVTAIPLGLSSRIAALSSSGTTLATVNERPYVLFVGQRTGYKNFAAFLTAFGSSPTLTGALDIVCFGGGALTTDERDAAVGNGINPDRLKHIAGSDEVLAAAYQNAEFMVYPSLYEGFGFPPLEAMALGCPVACSNTSSMPEVVGDAAVTFDPSRVDDIARAMDELAGDPALRARCRSAGSAQARTFTWQRCARDTRALYARTC